MVAWCAGAIVTYVRRRSTSSLDRSISPQSAKPVLRRDLQEGEDVPGGRRGAGEGGTERLARLLVAAQPLHDSAE
jgi:hypothetical protein